MSFVYQFISSAWKSAWHIVRTQQILAEQITGRVEKKIAGGGGRMDEDGSDGRLLEGSRGLRLTSLSVKRDKSQLIHLRSETDRVYCWLR